MMARAGAGLRLYDYPASPNCYKARLALAELGLDYERVPVDIFGGDTLRPDFAAKSPGLTTPVLEIAEGEYLPESNAILLYLTEGTELLPTDKTERAHVYRWLFFEQSRVVPFVGDRFTVADICLYGYVHAAAHGGIDLGAFPGISAWLERVRERPAHVADLAEFPGNAQIENSKSVYDLLGI